MMKMALILLMCILTSKPTVANELCVQSLNAYGVWKWQYDFFKTSYVKRAKLLNKTLSRECDVIALQEVWLSEFWNELKFPYKSSFISTNKKSIGTVFLGTKQFSSTVNRNFRLRAPGPGGVIRDLSIVNVGKGFSHGPKYLKGAKLNFINVHLHPGFTTLAKATRASQLIEVVNYIVDSKLHNEAIVITGDFNANTESLELRFLEDVFGFLGRESYKGHCTFAGLRGILCQSIDFILYKSGRELSLNQSVSTIHDINGDSFLTDHKLLTSKFIYHRVRDQEKTLPLKYLAEYKDKFTKLFIKGGKRYIKDIRLLDELVMKVSR